MNLGVHGTLNTRLGALSVTLRTLILLHWRHRWSPLSSGLTSDRGGGSIPFNGRGPSVLFVSPAKNCINEEDNEVAHDYSIDGLSSILQKKIFISTNKRT